MKVDYKQVPYNIGQILHAMTDKDAKVSDLMAAVGIVMHARTLWLNEGLAAAATFFDAQRATQEPAKNAPVPEDEDTSLFEEIDASTGNINQDDDNELVGIDGNITPDEKANIMEGEQLIIEAFKIISVDAELLANQSYWQPLTDALDKVFTAVNELEVIGEDNEFNISNPKLLYQEIEDILKVNVFSKEGLIMVWEEIASLFNQHLN